MASQSQPPPQQVGKYRLIRKLATGGMAEVFLAQAEGPAGFAKTMVLKKILGHLAEDTQFVEMFLNEARLAASLNHPNVVSIFDLGESNGAYFIAMEFIDGPNLRGLCKKAAAAGQVLPFEHATKIISMACEGLGYAHDFSENGQPLNLIHRDISPDNILISRQGAVKVVDFGIAKAANQGHMTKTGTLKGKLAYMPPEQLRGKALDRRADIFALGVVLYELVAGLKPFDATSEVATMQAILYEPPVPIGERRPDCPKELAAIIEKALQKERDNRYPDCRALQRDLDQFILARGAHVGAYELSQTVQAYHPPTPIQPQLTPSNSAPPLPPGSDEVVELSSFENVPSKVSPERGSVSRSNSGDFKATQVSPRKASNPSFEAMPTQARPSLEILDEPAPARQQSGGMNKGVVFGIVGVLALVLGAGAFFGMRAANAPADAPATTSPDPVAKVETPKPVETPKVAEPVKPVETAKVEEPKQPEPVVAKVEEPKQAEPAKAEEPKVAAAEPKKEAPKESKDAKEAAARKNRLEKALAMGEKQPAPKENPASNPQPAVAKAAAVTALIVETDPPSQVFVDGKLAGMGVATLNDIAPGTHSLRIANKDKGINRQTSVAVSPGETKREVVRVGQGVIKFRVKPYANVEIDGKSYGATPIPDGVTVYEGEHRVRLVFPDAGNKEQVKTLWIQPGQEETIKINLDQ